MEGATPGDIMQLVLLLIPIVLAWLNTYLFAGLKSVIAVIDGLPAVIQQVLYTIINWALLWLSIWIGMPLPDKLEGFMSVSLLAVITAVVGMGLHKRAKATEAPADPAKAAHR